MDFDIPTDDDILDLTLSVESVEMLKGLSVNNLGYLIFV